MIGTNGRFRSDVNRLDRPSRPSTYRHISTDIRRNPKLRWPNRPIPDNMEIAMDYHHIIPWNYLAQAWDALVYFECWDSLSLLLQISGIDKGEGDDILDQIKEDRFSGDLDRLFSAIAWPTWCLVEGPRNRSDAVANRPDKFVGRICPSKVRSRSYLALEYLSNARLLADLKEYGGGAGAGLTQRITLDPSETRIPDSRPRKISIQLTKLDKSYRDIAKRIHALRPIPLHQFDPLMWTLVKDGKMDKFDNTLVQPLWKKSF